MDYRIFPPDEMPEGADARIVLPTSKSVLGRLLIINAVASGSAAAFAGCDEASLSDDSRILIRDLSEGLPDDGRTVDIGAAGTAMRFLTAYYAASEGCHVVLDGIKRMRERPVSDLVDTLRLLGADIRYVAAEGFPPIEIHGRKLRGGTVEVDGTRSSQFVSALLMVAPLMAQPLTLSIRGTLVSEPYVKMTMGLMQRCGVDVERDINVISVAPGKYDVNEASLRMLREADWSAASYFYETAALTGCEVDIAGLSADSLQGDRRVADIFGKLGVESHFGNGGVSAQPSPEIYSTLDLDMSDTPDLVPAVAVAACMMRVPWRMTGVKNLRIKETDRIAAIIAEMDKLGCTLTTDHGDDVLMWEGAGHPVFSLPEIDTYGDHRIAMAFAPVAAYCPGIVIRDAEVVSKSFPDFWQQMQRLGFSLADAAEPMAEADEE